MTQPIFLSYRFNGWLVEFRGDYFEMVNPANQDRYRVNLDPYADLPFLILLLEKGRGPIEDEDSSR